MTKMSRQKFEYLEKEESFKDEIKNKKHKGLYQSNKGFSLKQIKPTFLEGESLTLRLKKMN